MLEDAKARSTYNAIPGEKPPHPVDVEGNPLESEEDIQDVLIPEPNYGDLKAQAKSLMREIAEAGVLEEHLDSLGSICRVLESASQKQLHLKALQEEVMENSFEVYELKRLKSHFKMIIMPNSLVYVSPHQSHPLEVMVSAVSKIPMNYVVDQTVFGDEALLKMAEASGMILIEGSVVAIPGLFRMGQAAALTKMLRDGILENIRVIQRDAVKTYG